MEIKKKPLLCAEYVEKYYGNQRSVTKALDQVSFSVESGEFLGIMGASGSGKTTLLNCISTIDSVSAGHIYLENRDITAFDGDALAAFRREQLGFVFQEYNLLDALTLEENMALPLTLANVGPAEAKKRVEEIAMQLQIADALDKFPTEVSGGQKQRCAFARAVVHKPKLILADEPTGALDSGSAMRLLESVKELNRVLATTILMVTHDALCASYCDRILFLKDGKIFNEIVKGQKERRAFYQEILEVLSVLGGT